MSKTFDFSVNGKAVSVSLDNEETPLLDVLRNELGLDGYALWLRARAMRLLHGADRRRAGEMLHKTGLERRRKADRHRRGPRQCREHPHPLQQAFLDEQAGQCGYCLAGILISAKALLDKNPKPSRAEIAQALDGNICRCGSHNRIMRAVEKAAAVYARGSSAMNAPLPGPLNDNPDLDRWVAFPSPGKVTVLTGRVELGQGVLTAMAQIAADELDVAMGRITIRSGDTEKAPNEGYTAGSQSIQFGGVALRSGLRRSSRAVPRSGRESARPARPANCPSATAASIATAHRPGRTTGRLPAQSICNVKATGGGAREAVSRSQNHRRPAAPVSDLPGKDLRRQRLHSRHAPSTAWCTRVSFASRTAARTIGSIDESAIRRAAKGPIEFVRNGNFRRDHRRQRDRGRKPPVPPLSIM